MAFDRPHARGVPRRRLPLAVVALAALIAAAVVLVSSGGGSGTAPSAASAAPPAATPASTPAASTVTGPSASATGQASPAGAKRPNIVFILTDDLSMDLLPYMPQVRALQSRGLTFSHYFVSDSLCCPSRASIFTGNFPHDTGVFTNSGPDGGITGFFGHHDEGDTFNLALHRAGYRTAMMGKYLNGYLQGPDRSPVPSTYVPEGWDEWDVAGWGYPEFNYELNEDGRLHHFGHAPRDYLTDVLTRRGVRFIDHSAHSGKPFFLELAPFSPHSPYTPAPRYAHDFPGLTAPRPANFDTLPVDPPTWLAGHQPLTDRQLRRIDRAFRRRAQAVQAIDDMLAEVRAAVARNHLRRDTYIVFSSDNGLHTGEYRLMPGKLTAFDTDIHVPLVIAGPGIRAGTTTDAMAENVDLAATFTQMGHTSLPSDGHSLMPLFADERPVGWPNAVLVEHRGPAPDASDPDAQDSSSGNPPTYEAMRSKRFLYVEYADGEREYYNLRNDPRELVNLASTLSPGQLDELHAELEQLKNCHSSAACWAAGRVAPAP